jgi:hypothetical protein
LEANGEIKENDVYCDLIRMNKDKYMEALGDMNPKDDQFPIWKEYDFLERDPYQKDMDITKMDEGQLKMEMSKLQHENKDLAAELDKSQSLLKLQTDIEKENRVYYEEEKERLKILAQSYTLKAQEMTKRVDGQARIIRDLRTRLGVDKVDANLEDPLKKYVRDDHTEHRDMERVIDEDSDFDDDGG